VAEGTRTVTNEYSEGAGRLGGLKSKNKEWTPFKWVVIGEGGGGGSSAVDAEGGGGEFDAI